MAVAVVLSALLILCFIFPVRPPTSFWRGFDLPAYNASALVLQYTPAVAVPSSACSCRTEVLPLL